MGHDSLEYEYKRLKIDETPDLWERIEPKLNEKQLSNHQAGGKFNFRKAAPIVGLMAAFMLILIAFPTILREKKFDTTTSNDSAIEGGVAAENAAEGNATDEARSLDAGGEMPREIIFLGEHYVWEEGTAVDIDPKRLPILGYVEAINNDGEAGNSLIIGAVVYENTDSSIIIGWQERCYIYRLSIR